MLPLYESLNLILFLLADDSESRQTGSDLPRAGSFVQEDCFCCSLTFLHSKEIFFSKLTLCFFILKTLPNFSLYRSGSFEFRSSIRKSKIEPVSNMQAMEHHSCDYREPCLTWILCHLRRHPFNISKISWLR